MRRTRSVPPLGTCTPADLRVAPDPTMSWSRRVLVRPGVLVAISFAIMHPSMPAPTMATDGGDTRSRSLQLVGRGLDRPFDEGGELILSADAAQPVEDALAAPRDQAEVGVGQPALLACGVLQENVMVGGAVPIHGE